MGQEQSGESHLFNSGGGGGYGGEAPYRPEPIPSPSNPPMMGIAPIPRPRIPDFPREPFPKPVPIPFTTNPPPVQK